MSDALIFSLVVLVTIGILGVIALRKCSTVADIKEVFTALGAVLGLTIGGAGTYFFTRGEVNELKDDQTKAVAQLQNAETKVASLNKEKETLAKTANTLQAIAKKQPAVKMVLTKAPELKGLFSTPISATMSPGAFTELQKAGDMWAARAPGFDVIFENKVH